MTIDAQQLLAPAIVAMYLKDCLLLLHRDEGVLVQSWSGQWRSGFGLQHWKLAGREPYVCNPFLPHQPVFRLHWRMTPASQKRWGSLAGATPELLSLRPWVIAIWLILFILMPVALMSGMGWMPALCVVVVLYGVIVSALLFTHRRRAALGLDRAKFAVLAFELLACPPYAPNLLRRVSLLRTVDEDLVVAGARLMTPARAADVRRACVSRVDEEIDATPEDSARHAALLASRRELQPTGQDHVDD